MLFHTEPMIQRECLSDFIFLICMTVGKQHRGAKPRSAYIYGIDSFNDIKVRSQFQIINVESPN